MYEEHRHCSDVWDDVRHRARRCRTAGRRCLAGSRGKLKERRAAAAWPAYAGTAAALFAACTVLLAGCERRVRGGTAVASSPASTATPPVRALDSTMARSATHSVPATSSALGATVISSQLAQFDHSLTLLCDVGVLTNPAVSYEQRATNVLHQLSLLSGDERRALANRLYWTKGADDVALAAYEYIAAHARDPEEAQIARSFVARVLARTGHLDEACQYLLAVPKETLEKLSGTSALVDHYGMLGALFCARNDYARQFEYAQQAWHAARAMSRADTRRQRELFDRKAELAYAYVNRGTYDVAESLFAELEATEDDAAMREVWTMNRTCCAQSRQGILKDDWKITYRQW